MELLLSLNASQDQLKPFQNEDDVEKEGKLNGQCCSRDHQQLFSVWLAKSLEADCLSRRLLDVDGDLIFMVYQHLSFSEDIKSVKKLMDRI